MRSTIFICTSSKMSTNAFVQFMNKHDQAMYSNSGIRVPLIQGNYKGKHLTITQKLCYYMFDRNTLLYIYIFYR